MAKIAVDLRYGSLSTYVYPGEYDSSKLGLGPLITQKTVVMKQATQVPIQLLLPGQWSNLQLLQAYTLG